MAFHSRISFTFRHSGGVSQSGPEWRQGAGKSNLVGWLPWVSDSSLQYVGEAAVKGHDFMWLWVSGTLIKTKLQFRILDNSWLALCPPAPCLTCDRQHSCVHWHSACSCCHPLSHLRSQRAHGSAFMSTRAMQPAYLSVREKSEKQRKQRVTTNKLEMQARM